MALRPRINADATAPGGGGNTAPSGLRARRLVRTPNTLTGELASVVEGIRKKNPNSGIVRTANSDVFDVGRMRTGVFALDLALGGGWALSRNHMLYGERSTGKTTVAILTVAQAQRDFPDKFAVWVDIEGTFDKNWASKLGVDLSRLVIIEPETGEQAVDLADAAFRTNECCCLVTDSIAMLIPSKEITESAETSIVGLHARLIGNYLRRLTNATLKERHRGHYPIILHINQFRMKIGVMFGDPRTLPGGKALEFATTQQVQMYNKEIMAKSEDLDGGEIVIYNEHEFKITKDKSGGKFKAGLFRIVRDADVTGLPEGYIDQAKTVVKYSGLIGTCTVAGGGNVQIGNTKLRGEAELKKWALENHAAFVKLQNDTLAAYKKKWNLS